MLNVDHKGLHIENLAELNREHSPSIPTKFPKDLLPKDKCQSSLALMLQCLMGSQQNKCGGYNKAYYQCKRERDSQIFTSIKDWEVDHFKSHSFIENPKERAKLNKLRQPTPVQEEYLY